MTYRSLGACGTKVSMFGLGGWTTFGGSVTDEGTVRRIITRAFDAGINFFDISDIYAKGEAERVMGKVLAGFPRHELVITTKLFWPMSDDVNDRGLSRKHIMESIEKSLKRIGTEYVDVYFCHRFDAETPLEETARAMDDLVHSGRVLYWGTSEWTGAQLRDVHAVCDDVKLYRPQVEQPQYSLLAREKFEQDVRPAAAARGMGLVVWSPLASGLLTGKYDDGIPEGSRLARIEWLRDEVRTEARVARVRRFASQAEQAGCSRAQLALAWAAAQPGVSSVILGATRVAQLEENLGAVSVGVTDDMRRALDDVFPATAG
ncbi:MAG: aldo/keto reductase family protein [Phycisphaerae bacterium]